MKLRPTMVFIMQIKKGKIETVIELTGDLS